MPVQLPVLRYTEGDTLPLVRVFAGKADGSAPSYAGYSLKLRIKNPSAVVEKTATLVDAATGEFLFTWSASDHVAGKHVGALVLTDPSGRKLTTRRVLFDVEAPIA